MIDGHRFYRAVVQERLLRKYEAETNLVPGEPGSKENPLVMLGKEYVYNEFCNLVRYIRHNASFVLRLASNLNPVF